MIVTANAMNNYRKKLRAVNEKCAKEVQAYMEANGFQIDDTFIEYAHSLTTKYGEAAAELSCQLYDELSEYWMSTNKGKKPWKHIPPAEPAKVATISDVAKTVKGTAKTSLTKIPEAVGTLVKRAAEDTTLHNALRDGAEFAWIPQGDTCAFCRVLASNGWRKMSEAALKNGHASHIHPNCDCSYVARMSADIDFEGYEPDKLYEEYKELGVNGIRRKLYEENKDKINQQHREAYHIRKMLGQSEE